MRATPIALLFCSACYIAPSEMPVASEAPARPVERAAPAEPHGLSCDMTKFSFTQDVGCVNDGWVEFCAEKGGAPTTTALRAIAPDVQIMEGMIGHAGCSETNEYLVMQPIHSGDCTQVLGALVDQAWDTLCALSRLPETKHFVPGFAE